MFRISDESYERVEVILEDIQDMDCSESRHDLQFLAAYDVSYVRNN